MRKTTKITISAIIILLIALGIFLIARSNNDVEVVDENNTEETIEMSLEVIENSVYLKDSDNITHDVLSISDEYGEILELNNLAVPTESISSKKFIINNDVNFDGVNDVAVLDGIGYGGVNLFYNYFVVNTETKKFEDYGELPHLINFTFDSESGEIESTYKIGPDMVRDEYNFTGAGYDQKLNIEI